MKKRDRTRPRPGALTEKQNAIRDRIRLSGLKWKGKPPGIPPAMVQTFERQIEGGKTIKDLTSVPSKSYMVPHSRFRKHCALYPTWAEKIEKLNKTSLSKKRKTNSAKRLATRMMCLKGLHRMSGYNVQLHKDGRRRCRACVDAGKHGRPMTAEMKAHINERLAGGSSLGEILWGKPLGGGPTDHSLKITTAAKFYYERKIDAHFAALVDKHILDSNVTGQIARHVRRGHKKGNTDAVLPPEIRPAIIAVGRLRHRLRTMAGGKYARTLKRQDEKRYRKQNNR